MFFGIDKEYSAVGVVSLGKKDLGYHPLEEVIESRENIRTNISSAVKQMQEAGIRYIDIDPCGDAEAVAEGAILGTYYFDNFKTEKKPAPVFDCYTKYTDDAASVKAAWQRGVLLAEGQNFSRELMEHPANLLTPTIFSQKVVDYLGKLDNVTVTVRDRAWAEEKKMFSFLSVANGSDQPPKFVEIEYKGGESGQAPLALVGKGITFDSGGISIKPSAFMEDMRADMGGGACVVASIYTAARLKLPINVMGFVPMTENLVSGKATKPGDVVTSMSGKTIQIDNTDAEGRLILCDALTYAQTFKPSAIIDMATLTGACVIALGCGASAAYTNSPFLWENIHLAGTRTGDRMWKMPLFNLYGKQIRDAGHLGDINNITGSRAGGSCTAAAFLKEFVTHDKWMHLDIAGVMDNKNEVPYLPKGMTGRPTRTLVEFMNIISS